MKHKIATMLTDFGTADYFVGAMKGALLSVAPDTNIVDITHDIPPQDIEAGAWTLANAYTCFPQGTVHVCVVDPGVGSVRRALAIRAGDYFFVAPDNGLLSPVFDRETSVEATDLTNQQYFRSEVSRTFHGRDLFAPVAGAILNGVSLGDLGRSVTDCVRLPRMTIERDAGGRLVGAVIHVDRFGNLVTNITHGDLPRPEVEATFEIRGRFVKGIREFFAAGVEGELYAVWGSAGHLEIVARNASAAHLLGATRGEAVICNRG